MWKKVVLLGFVGMIFLAFIACGKVTGANMLKISPPENDDLMISGVWNVTSYKVLDQNMYSDNKIPNLKGQNIYISSNKLSIDNQLFNKVSYKLKVVEGDYFISYEDKFTVKDLGLSSVDVITAADKNNNIFDFFNIGPNKSYIFYRGILLNVKKVADIQDSDFKTGNNEATINSSSIDVNSSNKGVLIGIKTPRELDEDGEYSKEEYKTLWIYSENGKVRINEAPDIMFPRPTGMWTLKKESREQNGHYQEYLVANPLYGKMKTPDLSKYGNNGNLNESITYIGNDYIGIETSTNEKFNGKYSKYAVLPVDNLYLNKGVPIEDIYNNGINKVYKENFDDNFNSLPENLKNRLDSKVNYTDYTLLRYEGKWVIEGKISGKNGSDASYNYMTNIKPNINLVRYDTLVLPWRILRADMPTIEDAYTSPDGKLAIVIIKGELLVYRITNNKLDGDAILRYPINDNAKVVMDQWCSGDYVSYWNNDFNEYSKKVNEEGN